MDGSVTATNEQLNLLLSKAIFALARAEQACAKSYSRLAKAAQAPELAKALHPEQTEIRNHIKRLGLINKLRKAKPIAMVNVSNIELPKLQKQQSRAQDQLISYVALQLQALKLSQYELILALVLQLQLAHAPELVQQCIDENKATSTWIKRTFQHLIA